MREKIQKRKRASDVLGDEHLLDLERLVESQEIPAPRLIPLPVDLYIAATAGVVGVKDCLYDPANEELVFYFLGNHFVRGES